MKTVSLAHLSTHGEFHKRAVANFNRVEAQEYESAHLFKESSYSWPGDWEGRTMLAWTLLAQTTGRQPKYLEEVMGMLPSHLNEKGYFGKIHPRGTVDEQQLSGNSWFLRALSEYYLWTKDDLTLKRINRIIDHLLLPATGYYSEYPILPEQRVYDGYAVGELQGKVGSWHLSTDIGCAFIMLDGATQAYQLAPRPELKALIEEMIEKFLTIDLISLSFQTHATLSALRGLMRYYELTEDRALLEKIVQTFNLYLARGMTENYANYNWFGRPHWTEPCAVVDSFILAVGLWKHTGKSSYLNEAHHIYYNGLGYGQRSNGGFGCDLCSGAHEGVLSPKEGLFEAYWCCTMRGGEGLSRAIESCYYTRGQEIIIPFYESSTTRLKLSTGEIALEQLTMYPIEGKTSFEIKENTCQEPIAWRLFIPAWVEASTLLLQLNGKRIEFVMEDGFAVVSGYFPQGSILELSFEISLRQELAFGFHTDIKGYSYRHGTLLLGVDNPEHEVKFTPEVRIIPLGEGVYRPDSSSYLLKPINNMIDLAGEEAIHNRKQVLFRE